MNQPILHLLTCKSRDTGSRSCLLANLLPLAGACDVGRASRTVMFARDDQTPVAPALLVAALRRHPSLSRLRIVGQAPDGPPGLRGADLLLFTQPGPPHSLSLTEARRRRIPVLAPDTWNERWVRDGVTGFLYRTGNPDSLALSLLAFLDLSASVVSEVVRRAHEHSASSAGPRTTPPPGPIGERP